MYEVEDSPEGLRVELHQHVMLAAAHTPFTSLHC